MLAFAEEGPDVCVMETGLGGRLDATNVVSPAVAIITTLGLDHTNILGDTLPEIAMQKAGIIKPGAPVVAAPQPESVERLLRRVAQGAGAPIHFPEPFEVLETQPLSPDDVRPGRVPRLRERVAGHYRGFPIEARMALAGRHQAVNAGVASTACEALHVAADVQLPHGILRDGLQQVYWPARVELIETQPWLVIDCAHNQASARALMSALRRHLRYERMIVVLAASEDKAVEPVAGELASAHHAILTQAALPRAMPAETLQRSIARAWRSYEAIPSPVAALGRARELAGPRDLICITGSVFLIGDLIEAGDIDLRLHGL